MESQDATPVSSSRDYVFQFAAARPRKSQANALCFAARASGLFCSRDEGRTWESAYAGLQTHEPLPTTSVVLAPDFEQDHTIFAGLNGAILCSYDGGATWQRGRLPSPLPAVSAMCISPSYTEDGSAFAGTSEDGLLISRDRGRSWVTWNFGLLDLNILCIAISSEFAVDETIFAGTGSGLFRSTNGGRAWKEVELPVPPDAILSLALPPTLTKDSALFVGTENNGLLISRDRGKSWRLTAAVTCDAPVNQILVAAHAHRNEVRILLGSTLWSSVDQGTTWKPWKARRLGNCGVTAALPLETSRRALLAGLEDGRIVRV